MNKKYLLLCIFRNYNKVNILMIFFHGPMKNALKAFDFVKKWYKFGSASATNGSEFLFKAR